MAVKDRVDYDAVVIGAGFGGIRSLWELSQQGLTLKCFETAGDVGGVWFWNRYPAARTDSEAWVYSMNFAPGAKEEWNYSERYPGQEEVQTYLSRIAGELAYSIKTNASFNRCQQTVLTCVSTFNSMPASKAPSGTNIDNCGE